VISERRTPAQGAGAQKLRALLGTAGALPAPGSGRTAQRWHRLLAWGRADLPMARLAEGHTDAMAILQDAGAAAAPGALYGVWAARSGGTGAELVGSTLRGTVRFCSGAHGLDRALVVAAAADGSRLVDLDLRAPGVRPVDGTWQAPGMRDSDTVDVELTDIAVPATDVVGEPGWYTERPGFWWGGGGVAAVWLGGALGVLDALTAQLSSRADPFQLAHLGALHASVEATRALLDATATLIDADPGSAHRTAVWTLRAAAERSCRDVLDLAPRVAGVAALTRSPLGQQLADLGLYIRQHHGERDLAALGAAVLDAGRGSAGVGDNR
jgi:alkylation response protein AidB-like acyl-CoA dehydrogenase